MILLGSGAPTKLTKECKEKILKGITGGLTNRLAAHYAGIHEDTFYSWLKSANDDLKAGKRTELVEFSEAIKRARAEKALKLLGYLENPDKFWQAHKELLVRCYREDYADDGGDLKELKEIVEQILALKRK